MASKKDSESPNTNPSELPRGLLGKGGTPVGKSARLPSVRSSRDLTLGGSQKKSFKPNLPARPREKVAASSIEEKLDTKQSRPKRERNQSDKSKSRRSNAPSTIQSASIFEQDVGDRVVKRESIYSGGEGQRRTTSTVRTSGGREDKFETQKILDRLLRDDFLDQPDDDLADITEQPVSLPLYNSPKTEHKIKGEPGEAKPALLAPKDDSLNLSHLMDNTGDSMKLVLVQMPDEVPGIMSKDDHTASTSQATVDDLSRSVDACQLQNLTEGKIGRMRVYRSGRAEIVLGEHVFNMNRGVPCGFLQEVVYLNTELEEIAALGPVSDKLIVVPNIDNLLNSCAS